MTGAITAYTGSDFMTSVGSAITSVLGWCKTVIDSLLTETGDLHSLLPLFAVTVAISGIMLGCKIIKTFVWGA